MARIPQRSLVTPRFSGVDVPQGAFGAPAQAMAGLMQTIGGSVDVVLQHAQKAQEIRNKADVREQVRQMRQEQADFMREVEANKIDPADWNKEWQARLGQFEARLKSKKYPPVVIEQVTNHFKDFAGESMISISGAALKENLRRARAGVELDHNDFMRTEQFDKAEENIQQAVDEGTFDEVTGNAMLQGIRYKQEETDMDVHMRIDPVDFIENIDDYDLSPKRKLDTLDKAKRELSAAGRRGVEAINEGIELGLIQSKDELKAELEHYNAIPKVVKNSILKNFANRKPLTNEEKLPLEAQMRDDLEAFRKGEISLAEYGRRHDELGAQINALGDRQGTVGDLKSKHYQRSPVLFQREGDTDPEQQARQRAKAFKDPVDDAKKVARDRASGLTKARTIKAIEKDAGLDRNTSRRAEFDTEMSQKSHDFYRRMETELIDWVASQDPTNPPTVTDIRAQADKIQPRVLKELKDAQEAAREDVQTFFDNPVLQEFDEFRQEMDPVNPLLNPRPR